MVLIMKSGGRVMASIPIHPKNLSIPGYVEGLKASCLEENENFIDLGNEEPEFYLEEIPAAETPLFSRYLKTLQREN